MAALVGATLRDRYRLEEALGSGAFATVYRARDLLLGRQVAVKVVDEATASPQALARFAREGRIACKVDSEWVARVFDQGEHAGLRFLVQEFVDGEALAARVARAGPLSPGDVLRVGVLLSAGLEALHAEGILHRDLKPENVVLSSAGGAKIVDFGVAAAEEAPSPRLTDPRALLGTPLTLAPEVVSGGASCASAASDVYALAATLAFAATGRCPHDPERGDGTGFLLRRAFEPAEDLRALRPELPEPLCAWIARCLDRDPAARPSVAELHEGLGALHRSPPRGVPTAARRRAPIALGAVGVVGSLALSLAAIRAQWPGEESAHRAAVTDRPREGGDGAQADRALSPQRRPGPGPSPGSEGAPLPRDPGAAERRRGAGSGRAGEGLRSPGGASGAARGALPLPVRGSAGEGGPLPPPGNGGRAPRQASGGPGAPAPARPSGDGRVEAAWGAAERSAALGSVELELRECFRRLPVDTVGAQAALLRARHALDELGAGAAAAPARSRAQLLGRIAGVLAAVLEADAGRPEIARLLGSLRAQCARAEGPVAAEALRELDRGLDLLKLAERVVLGERAGEERRLGAAGSDLRDLVAVLDAIDRPASLGPGTPFPPHAVRAWKRLRSTFLGRWLRQAIRGVERVGRMRSEQPELPPTVALLAAASAEVAEQGRLGAFGAARVLELRPGAEYEVLSRVPVRALAFPLPELPAAASPGLRIAVFGAGRDRFELLPGGARKGSEASRRCAGWGRLAVVERVAADRIVLYGVEVSTERWRLVASLAFEATPKNDGPVGFFWLPERTSAYPLPPVAVRDLR